LLAIVWQTVAVFSPWTVANRAAEVEHMTLHVQEDGHHHHDDLAFHVDEQDDGPQHLHADSGLHSFGLIADTGTVMPQANPPSPATQDERAAAPPFIEGPMRPPRANA
jgi:hypothetical protein